MVYTWEYMGSQQGVYFSFLAVLIWLQEIQESILFFSKFLKKWEIKNKRTEK